jgi:hypothetical protein
MLLLLPRLWVVEWRRLSLLLLLLHLQLLLHLRVLLALLLLPLLWLLRQHLLLRRFQQMLPGEWPAQSLSCC